MFWGFIKKSGVDTSKQSEFNGSRYYQEIVVDLQRQSAKTNPKNTDDIGKFVLENCRLSQTFLWRNFVSKSVEPDTKTTANSQDNNNL